MHDVSRILKLIVIAVLVLGLAYPFAFLLEGRLVGNRAEGNLISRDGQVVGARNIGQSFTSDMLFQGRPSAAGDGYDTMASGGSNLGPTNPALTQLVQERMAALLAANPGLAAEAVPVDLVTASGSGLDPDISEEAALIQVPRISRATGITEEDLVAMVKGVLHGRWLGIFGEPGVNVLKLNLALLDKLKEVAK